MPGIIVVAFWVKPAREYKRQLALLAKKIRRVSIDKTVNEKVRKMNNIINFNHRRFIKLLDAEKNVYHGRLQSGYGREKTPLSAEHKALLRSTFGVK